jgi:DNA replication and repair protein RecF
MVVSFGPEDISLVQGGPVERRRYMDTLLSQQDSAYLRHLIDYRRCLQNRNKLLEQRCGDRLQFQVYEEALAEHGAYLHVKRFELFCMLENRFRETYDSIAFCGEKGEIRFTPSVRTDSNTIEEWKNVFLEVMDEGRAGDLSLGYSSRGPHRDDFRCLLNGRAARSYASQGQCRSLALALRLSSVFCLKRQSSEEMILLVDDAHTELDSDRTQQLYPLIKGQGQLLVTSHNRDLPHLEGIARYRVAEGTVAGI